MGIGFACYGLGGLIYETKFGRPSSTSALGFFAIPIISLLIGGAASVIAFGVRLLWKITGLRVIFVEPWIIAVICGTLIVAALILGVGNARRYELNSGPAIVVNRGAGKQIDVLPDWNISRSAATISYVDLAQETFEWGRNRTIVRLKPNGLSVRQEQGNQECVIPILGLDYVTSVHVAEFTALDSDPKLALLINGRATGHRAILAILSSNYEPFYIERMDRFWQLTDRPLAIYYSETLRSEVVVLRSGTRLKGYAF